MEQRQVPTGLHAAGAANDPVKRSHFYGDFGYDYIPISLNLFLKLK
jgi:hypothetical protein